MRTLIAIVFVVLFFPLKAISAQIHLTETIEEMPYYITDVYQCGRWRLADGEGYFRIVYIDFYFGNSLLYVQWVKDTIPPNGHTREVIKTLSISEFNADDHIEFMFKKPRCKRTKDGVEFDITADSGHDEEIHKFKLRIFSEPGKYTIKHAEFMPSRQKKK